MSLDAVCMAGLENFIAFTIMLASWLAISGGVTAGDVVLFRTVLSVYHLGTYLVPACLST